MNFTLNDSSFPAFALLAAAFGLVTTVFWMIVAWRAMRAHERIADQLRDVLERR